MAHTQINSIVCVVRLRQSLPLLAAATPVEQTVLVPPSVAKQSLPCSAETMAFVRETIGYIMNLITDEVRTVLMENFTIRFTKM